MADDRSTILVVDDEAIVRTFFADVLARAGYDVIQSGDGSEALEAFESEENRIALVLLDLSLPGMSGYEALAELQIMDPDLDIIVVTGLEADEEQLPGISGILRKPIKIDELLGAVQSALHQH